MGRLARMEGTPWHIEHFEREEGDERRHKSRCIYHNKDGTCSYFMGKCRGAAHCNPYKESKKKANKPTGQKPIGKSKKSDVEIYNELAEKAVITKIDTTKDIGSSSVGLAEVAMRDIYVADSFKEIEPDSKEICKIKEYYQKNKELDKPITVKRVGGKYQLVDQYSRYYAAKELGATRVPIEYGSEEELKLMNLLRTPGSVVNVSRQGTGTVVDFTFKTTSIRFGKNTPPKTFDIVTSVKKKSIRLHTEKKKKE